MHNKSSEVCIKTRSTPASLPFRGQVTNPTARKWSICVLDFQMFTTSMDLSPSFSRTYRGILVYKICLISIRNSVSDGATNISLLNIEGHSTINSASEYEPDVLNTFSATRV